MYNNKEDKILETETRKTTETTETTKTIETTENKYKVIESNNKKKTGKETADKKKITEVFVPVIFWTIVSIIVVIILIGIIIFLSTMPGMVMDKIKSLNINIANATALFYGADLNKRMSNVKIFDILDYLEDMGYDLKGFGFLTDYYDLSNKDDIEDIRTALDLDKEKPFKDALASSSEGYKYDEKTGVFRNKDNKIALAKSHFIFTYMVSDNYKYTIKDEDIVTEKNWNSFWSYIKQAVDNIWSKEYQFKNYLFEPIYTSLGNPETIQDKWGKRINSFIL